MPNTAGSVDLSALSTEEQEAIEKLAEETGAEPEEPSSTSVETAFLVIIKDGQVVVAPPDTKVVIEREATTDVIYGAVATIQKDLQAAETAQAMLQAQMQQVRAMQQQSQAQQIRQGLNL